MTAPSPAVANEFLKLGKTYLKPFNQMQLQKLVYIAHGWNLSINDSPLTSDSPKVYSYGAVYKDINESLRYCGRENVKKLIEYKDYGFGMIGKNANDVVHGNFTEDEFAVIKKVFDVYGDFEFTQLSALTHHKDTPWYKMYKEGHREQSNIPCSLIKEQFIKITKDGHKRDNKMEDDIKYVYVISNKAWKNAFKVGITDDIQRRLQQYQTYSPHRDYMIEFEMKTKYAKNIEKILHGRYNSNDEWCYGELKEIIKDIKTQCERFNDVTKS